MHPKGPFNRPLTPGSDLDLGLGILNLASKKTFCHALLSVKFKEIRFTGNGFDFLSVKKTLHLFKGRVLHTRIKD